MKIILFIFSLLIFLFSLFSVSRVNAALPVSDGGGGGSSSIIWGNCSITNSSGVVIPTLDCAFLLIQTIINWLLAFAGVVALVLIIYSGIKLITSGGDPKQVEGAKKILTYAIIGLLVILLSFAIISLIAYATGVNCIKLMGFDACL